MLEIFKQNASLEKLKKAEETISTDSIKLDLITYTEFLKYFSDIKEITEHHLVIGICFTYAWMPTMFRFRNNDFKPIVIILNNAKAGKIPTESELEVLKKCFNNSLVGTSKLLHFINPKKFAIWDSRVYRYLADHKPHQYRLDNCKSYLDYLEFCTYITAHNDYKAIHDSVVKKANDEITKFRSLELIMYLKGGQPIPSKSL